MSRILEEAGEGAQAAAPPPQFDWYRQWYPMHVIEDLDPSIPHAVQLLGMDLVLWRDRGGAWRCFEDRCPHRLAALSEGRIDEKSGDLYCNYHGWQFDGAGQCTRIPQLDAEQQQGPQVRSPRACAVSYPTREAEGLLWVWGRGGPGAEAEAGAAECKGVAGLVDQEGEAAYTSSHRWYYRDIPSTYLATKENSFNDPAHDFVLHHQAAPGLNRASARPLDATLREMSPRGYEIHLSRPDFTHFGTSIDTSVFPCGASRQFPQRSFQGVAYTVPAAKDRVLLFFTFLQAPRPQTALARWWQGLVAPRWLAHLRSHVLMDADCIIQYSVDRNRSRDARMYLPAEADRGPAAFLTWMQKYGGGGPPVSNLRSPPIDVSQPAVPRRVLLDRYEQHTKHCKDCREAHAFLAVLASAARLVAVLAAAAAAACLAVQGPSLKAGALAAGAAAAAALHAWLRRMVQQFIFVDYDERHVSKQ